MNLHLPTAAAAHLPTFWCLFDGNDLYLEAGALPQDSALPRSGVRFIGHNDAANLYAAELIGAPPAHWQRVGLRQAIYTLPAEYTPLLARAAQLRRFDRSHRYCGACAAPLHSNPHDHGKQCLSCGELFYPKLSPAMMVVIYRPGQILLARSPHFTPGMYSALAGFVEAGETLEQCVHREAFEEVGVRVRNLRYLRSQSWPFPHSLMLAFIAEYDGGDITPQPGEIEHAAWFDLDALPPIPPPRSIAHQVIQDYLALAASTSY